jgi:hypothetical protein
MCGPIPAIAYSPPAKNPAAGDASNRPIATMRSVIVAPATTAPSRIAQAECEIEISRR